MAKKLPAQRPKQGIERGVFVCCSVDDHAAGSKAAHQCADAVLHLDAGKAQTESGLHILQPVVNENTFPALSWYLSSRAL